MAVVQRCVAWLNPRRGLILILALCWAGLVAASAGRVADGQAWLGLPNLDALLYVFMAIIVLGGVLFVSALIMARGQSRPVLRRRKSNWPMMLLVFFLLLFALGRAENISPQEAEELDQPVAAQPDEELGEAARTGPDPGLGEFVVLLAMLAVAATVLFVVNRKLSEDTEEEILEEGLEAALAPAVERARRQLLEGTDPRSSVLAAYAGLELTLTEAGCPPEPHETPGEHIRRALGTLSIRIEALMELAELYHRARFSPQEITGDQQQRAAAALQRVRAEMAATG